MRGTKILLGIAGALAVAVGLAMALATRAFLAPEGIDVDDKVALLGQAQGALLVGVGAIDLLALRTIDRAALQAILGGNLVMHVAALVVNVHALSAHLVGSGVLGDAIGHVVFAGAFAASLFARSKHPAPAAP